MIPVILLIQGASHTGKTLLAQRVLAKYQVPYLSVDHLKMGLIRSGQTRLTPMSDERELTAYLWPIVREMIKTAIENRQNLVVEGCYLPIDWQKDFDDAYITQIRSICLIMSAKYITEHFDDIRKYANVIEHRQDDSDCTPERLLAENAALLTLAQQHHANYFLVEDSYRVQDLPIDCTFD